MVLGELLWEGGVADRQGFEPWRRFPAYTLSRRAPSTTRPPVRKGGVIHRPNISARPLGHFEADQMHDNHAEFSIHPLSAKQHSVFIRIGRN